MNLAVDIISSALLISAMYILASLGFSFVFNMLGIINLAHGAIYMLGAYACFAILSVTHMNQWLALIITAIIIAAFGILLERFCFRPFPKDFTRVTMACVAVMLLLQTTINILVGNKTQAISPFAEGTVKIGGASVSKERIVIFVIGAALLAVVLIFCNFTRIGRQMQAVAQSRVGAELQGIDIHKVSAIASAIGCALAAVSGSMMGAYISLSAFMGDSMLGKVLMIVMLAGAGSTGGIIITGLLLGFMDAILPIYIFGGYSDLLAVCVVILLLLIRPQGFFGHEA